MQRPSNIISIEFSNLIKEQMLETKYIYFFSLFKLFNEEKICVSFVLLVKQLQY